MTSTVLCEQQENCFNIRFNRPDRLNAINSELASEFLAAVDKATSNPAVDLIIISGAGRAFMAGGDIAQFAEDPRSITEGLIEPMNQALLKLAECSQLVLGVVQGPAAGAGMSLALACDLVLASNSASFSFAYSQLAVSGDLGISWNLPRLLGTRRALEYALLGDSIKADEALSMGLVNRLVPDEHLNDELACLSRKLCRITPEARKQIKQLMRNSFEHDFASQLQAEKQGFAACIETPAFSQAVERFLNKSS